MEAFGKFCASIIFGALAMAVRGWAVKTLWYWFVVSHFGAASLSWSVAYGLTLITALLVHTEGPDRSKESWGLQTSHIVMTGIIGPILLVGIGWIIK